MKKIAVVFLAIISGLIVYGLINIIAEFSIPYFSVFPIIAVGLSIFAGYKVYSYLALRWSIPMVLPASKMSVSQNAMRWVLFILLATQIFFSVGYANEYADYVIMFISTVIFFFFEIYLVYRVSPKRGAAIFIVVLLLLAFFNLLVFLTDKDVISNKYPAEEYYGTYGYVLFMLIVSVVLEITKLATLYFRKRHEPLVSVTETPTSSE